jgi:RNA-directed DNA polymerase
MRKPTFIKNYLNAELTTQGVNKDLAARTAGSIHEPWRVSRIPGLSYAYPNAYFSALGLVSLEHG